MAEGRTRADRTPEEREQLVRANLDTCHVWARDGRRVAGLRSGAPEVVSDPLLPIQERLRRLGREGSGWH